MNKTKLAEKLVDMILDGDYNKLKEAATLTDKYLSLLGESTENEISEVPESIPQTMKDVETEVESDATSVAKDKDPDTNEIPHEPVAATSAKAAVVKDIAESLSISDFSDYFDDLKKKGMNDESKFAGMLNRAEAIAKEQGKEGDKKTIVGIMQSFMSGN